MAFRNRQSANDAAMAAMGVAVEEVADFFDTYRDAVHLLIQDDHTAGVDELAEDLSNEGRHLLSLMVQNEAIAYIRDRFQIDDEEDDED